MYEWAAALWTLFGTYLVVLWAVGAVAYAVARLAQRQSPAKRRGGAAMAEVTR